LEDLVALIDTPLLVDLDVTFFHQLIYDTPQLAQFIGLMPNFKTDGEAQVIFCTSVIKVILLRTNGRELKLGISYEQSAYYWNLSSLAQVCSSSLPQALFPAVERLYIIGSWEADIENSHWLDLFHPFTAVEDLYIPQESTASVASAFQELVGERVIEVLPALKTLFLEELFPSEAVQEAIGRFVSARQLASHPVAISRWEC
jgi:hypothetical protein